MYWQEDRRGDEVAAPGEIVDLAFNIRCAALPVDHGQALSDEVRRLLPWFDDEPAAGLHAIHGAESGNGWERPEGEGEVIYLSRRAKLVLRLPKQRVEAAHALAGARIFIAGHALEVADAHIRLLSATGTLYARYVTFGYDEEDEETFLRRAAMEFENEGFHVRKLLCGKPNYIATAKGPLLTRRFMVSGFPKEESVRLQQQGVGLLRKVGCGLFIAHKPV